MTKRMLLHGLEGSSQGHKATHIKGLVDDLVVPDFDGDLYARLDKMAGLMGDEKQTWILVGSSLGGLMAAIWTCQHPERVRKLILLAPALHRPDFDHLLEVRIPVPTTLVHGTKDRVVPLDPVYERARKVFINLQFHVVEDDHRLRVTTEMLDWPRLLEV